MKLAITPNDIADAKKNRKLLGDRLKKFRLILIIIVVCGWAAIATMLLAYYLPKPSIPKNSFRAIDLFLLPVILALTVYETILIHELGHLIAGLTNRFEFNYLVIGPLKIIKGNQGIRFTFSGSKAIQTGGLASLVPTDEVNLKNRYMWMIAGGPLANVLQVVIFVMVIVLFRGQFTTVLINLFLFMSVALPVVLFLPASIIPMTNGGFTNDGAKIWLLLKGEERSQWYLLLLLLMSYLYKGCSLGKLDFSRLQKMQDLAESEMEKFVTSTLMYDFHMDNGNFAKAAAALDTTLFSVQKEPQIVVSPLAFVEAAYYESQINKDEETARAWLDLAQKDHKRKSMFVPMESLLRAEAAVLLAEGEFAIAYEKATEALTEIESNANRAGRKLELSYLEKIIAQCLAQLGKTSSINLVNRNWRTTWAISKNLLKITGVFGSMILVVLCLLLLTITGFRYSMAGFYYELKGDDSRALQVYEAGLASLDRPDSDLLNSHGEVLLRQGRFIEALEDFNASIEADPDHYRGYMNRGMLYLEMDIYELAIPDFNSSLELEPIKSNIVDIYFARAASLSGISEYDLAAQDYDQILQISDDSDDIELASHYRNIVLGIPDE